MTTKELVQWVLDAEEWHEKNWHNLKGKELEKAMQQPNLFKYKALELTKPPSHKRVTITDPTAAEEQIAQIFIREYWNDCQYWINDL